MNIDMLPCPEYEVHIRSCEPHFADRLLHECPRRVTPLVAIVSGSSDVHAIAGELVGPVGEIPVEVGHVPEKSWR